MKKNADRGYEKTKPKQTQFIPTEGGTNPILNRAKIAGLQPNCCYNN
jgi:hypothetical protein